MPFADRIADRFKPISRAGIAADRLALRDAVDFFNGSQLGVSPRTDEPDGAGLNPLIAFGVIGRWDGKRTGISSFETFDDLMNGDDSPFKDCEPCDQLDLATKNAAEVLKMRRQPP
ncbi:MAG: hypothetical protein ACLTF7_04800 [Bifidobacterium breve]